MKTLALLTWLHVMGLLVWVGALASVVVLLGCDEAPKRRAAMARSLYLRLAVPGFVVALAAGLLRFVHPLQGLHYYFVERRSMLLKLAFAIGLVVIHHVIGARARRMAQGEEVELGGLLRLGAAGFVCVAAAAYFAVVSPF